MPQLPTVELRERIPRPQLPDVMAGPGQFAAKGLDVLGEAFQHAQDQQDSFEAKRQAVLLDTNLDLLKETIREEPDFAKRDNLYREKAGEYLATATAGIESRRVQQSLNQYFSLKFPQEALKVKIGTQKEWGEHRVAQADALGEMMADKIVTSDDPRDVQKYKSLYLGQLDQLSTGPFAPLTAVKRQNMEQAFVNRVASKRADHMIARNAPGFLADLDSGKFGDLTSAQVDEKRATAIKKIESDEKASDKVTKDLKDIVLRNAEGLANTGRLPEDWLQDALTNGNALVTPAQAAHLQRVNENPATGEGNAQVAALRQMYQLTNGTSQDVARYQAQLRNLARDLGKPNKELTKFANELQADLFRATNQGIAMETLNYQKGEREGRALIDTLKANQPAMPFNMPLLENLQKKTEAMIRTNVRSGDSEKAKKLAEGKEKENKVKQIEKDHGRALNFGK